MSTESADNLLIWALALLLALCFLWGIVHRIRRARAAAANDLALSGRRARANYIKHSVWLVVVSIGAIALYVSFLDFLRVYVLPLTGISNIDTWLAQRSALAWGFTIIAGVLFWWRVVKVVVFLGSPFRLGLKSFTNLRQNGAENGRSVVVTLIEDRDKKGILLGVVARAHPSSDKIVRSRIETLMLELPGHRTLVVRGSVFSWPILGPDGKMDEFFEAWKGHHRYWRNQNRDIGMSMTQLLKTDEPKQP